MPPKMESMETPVTRAEFEMRIFMVREQIQAGKMHVGPLIDDLTKVRCLPNGRIDMLSVNEAARLNANMTYRFSLMDLGQLVTRDAGDQSEDK